MRQRGKSRYCFASSFDISEISRVGIAGNHCGADPLVRGRPLRGCILIPSKSGSGGTRADQGVRPTMRISFAPLIKLTHYPYFASAGIVLKAGPGGNLRPSTRICPPAGVWNSRVPRRCAVIGKRVPRSNEVCPCAASPTVVDCKTFPLSSLITTGIVAAVVLTLASATPVAYPPVVSNGITKEPGVRVSSGTTASCVGPPAVWPNTAYAPMLPLDNSCAQPV